MRGILNPQQISFASSYDRAGGHGSTPYENDTLARTEFQPLFADHLRLLMMTSSLTELLRDELIIAKDLFVAGMP